MKYRRFGKLDWEISVLSAGVLTFEEIVSKGEISRTERIEAVRRAVDAGVNYINLGYPFCCENPDEACAYVKEALSDGYREKVRLALNIPAGDAKSAGDLDRRLDEQLRWFDLSRAEFCILDRVNRFVWDNLKKIDAAAWAARITASGKAGDMGLAFHDDAHYLKEINDCYPHWAVVQMELSLLDYKHHPGVGGFKFTQQYGNAVVATDVTKAGRLLRNIPQDVREIWERANPKRSVAEWCTRWTLGYDEVCSALIGFESAAQVDEYLATIASFSAGDAGVWERLQASRVKDAYDARRFMPCTACRCCMPCENGIDAPRIVELYNDALLFSDDRLPKLLYQLEGHSDQDCLKCGKCAERCPKHLPLAEAVCNCRDLLHSETIQR